ncbi:MAG TPA: NADPH cytochrome P450 oxidoreductase family protein [Cellvibrionaceae bacterium]
MHNLEAALLVSAYLLVCFGYWRKWHKVHAAVSLAGDGKRLLVGFASQTGKAFQLAQQAAQTLAQSGISSQILPLNAITPSHLSEYSQALYIVSTYGEGEPPDNASQFVRQHLQHLAASALEHMQFGVFALGDSRYEHFCGFGHQLQQALRAKGARPWFAPLELDRQCSTSGQRWHEYLTHLGAEHSPPTAVPANDGWQQWTLSTRKHLNPASPGAPLYRLRLKPTESQILHWRAGDVVEVAVDGSPDVAPRSYTIASLPCHGYIELVVRQHWSAGTHALPKLGLASGWLTERATLGTALTVRTIASPAPALDLDRPWILIGAGSGIAGVIAQLHARNQATHCDGCWVIFGERDPQADQPFAEEIAQWQAQGLISRLDKTFSQSACKPNEPSYVQDIVHTAADTMRAWINSGAQIYLCGSRSGLGISVHEALVSLVGELKLTQMHSQGHYWRDVY